MKSNDAIMVEIYFSERPRSPMAARGAFPAQERSDSQEA